MMRDRARQHRQEVVVRLPEGASAGEEAHAVDDTRTNVPEGVPGVARRLQFRHPAADLEQRPVMTRVALSMSGHTAFRFPRGAPATCRDVDHSLRNGRTPTFPIAGLRPLSGRA
jgi:hypothetical protein